MRDADTPQVFLRIFSGAQSGAEAGLPPGTFVIGTDESCDIIFAKSGLEPRHLELIIKPSLLHLDASHQTKENGAPSSFVSPTFVALDGDVYVNNEVLASGSQLTPGVPLFMGTICVALARPESIEADWNAVRDALQALASPQSSHSASQEDLPPVIVGGKNVGPLEDAGANNVDNTLPALDTKTLPTQNRRKANIFTTCLAATALGLLIFQYTPDTDAQKPMQALRQLLVENGFEHIDILMEKQNVVLKGILRNDNERARLLSLARNMQYPVHLGISIQQDRKNAIEAAFSGRGFQLEVTDVPDENVLLIAGYMQDRLVEEWAFLSSRDDVPDFESSSAGVVRRRIRYAEDVAAILEPALKRANLEFVSVKYRQGHVELRAELDGEQKVRLQEVLSAVREQLGVPVPVQLMTQKQDAPAVRGSKHEKSTPANGIPVAEPQRMPTAFRVVEVGMSPIPFVRLATGERVFEGGLMPGNFILARITLHELTLTKGDSESIYTLRGAQ